MSDAPSGERPSWFKYDYSNFYHASGDDLLNLVGPFHAWYTEALQRGYALYSEALHTEPRPEARVQDRRTGKVEDLVNFASYNYLGLSFRPEVRAAAIAAVERYGLGASGSPILSGMFDVHRALEDRLARFKKKEAAILFPTGYSANVGLLSALLRPGDHALVDQYAHASIVDGVTLGRAELHYFRHNDAADLERKLARTRGRTLVAVEGVYSMDGDVCALPAVVEVARRHGARILLDEAHSSFVFGAEGRGIAEHFGLEDEVDLHLGTFSKALGGQGGFVCGSRALIDYLNAFARSRFFSCNLAPAVTAGVLAALEIVEREPQLRARLWENVAKLRALLASEGVDVGVTESQILPVMVRNDAKVFEVADRVQAAGIFAQPITYPAVPKHRSRLRLSVSALHTDAHLALAARAVGDALRAEGIQ